MSRKKDIIQIINDHFPESSYREIVKDYICNLVDDNKRLKNTLTHIRNNKRDKFKNNY